MTQRIKRLQPGALTRLLAVAVALALTTSACGGGSDEDEGGDVPAVSSDENPAPQGEPQEGGSITVGLEAESNGWRPGTSNVATAGYNVMYAIYDPLIVRTAEGGFEPYLAESFEPNADFTAWTFKLRDGVTFHDGSPLTAEVIQQNVALLKEPTSNLAGAMIEVATVDAVDPLTVRYNLSSPNASFPNLLSAAAGMPFSMKNYEENGEDGASTQPVGTGPFKFESWQRDSQFVAAANDQYWGKDLGLGPYLDEIVFRPILDEDTRLQSLQAGDLDAMHSTIGTSITQAREAGEDGDLSLHTYVGNPGSSTILNTAVAPLDDARVRRGLAMALDPEQLIDVLGSTGIAEPKTQYYGEESPFYSQAAADAYPTFDPDAAEALLKEYVDDPNRSDGKAAGTPLAVEYGCPPAPGLTELAQAVQAFWGNVGVEVDLQSVDQATHIQQAVGSPADTPPFTGDWQAKCWRSGYETDPFNLFKLEFFTPAMNPLNFTNYTSPELDEQLMALSVAGDVEAQQAAAEKVGVHLAENMPVLWAGSVVTMLATQPGVQNLSSWKLPDGSEGLGAGLYGGGVGMWGQVWTTQ